MFATINVAPRAGGENRKLQRNKVPHTQQPKKSVLEKDEEGDEKWRENFEPKNPSRIRDGRGG
jgi:hypothetical protein